MGWLFGTNKTSMVSPENALPGRATRMAVPARHAVLDVPPAPPYPEGSEIADFGLGCFWGAERVFWQTPGVVTTSVGYAGGYTQNPTYEEVCTGQTGHTELVRVVFDPSRVSYEELLRVFWEGHNPTQGMRQGNDVGTQYRSAIYFHSPEQEKSALTSRDAYQKVLTESGYDKITTEIAPAGDYYFAEQYHQQYLYKNPGGYCGIGGTSVKLGDPSEWAACQTGLVSAEE
jgi:peptide-methionine (S)-S-oxide reductase